ncbi:HNH endonuclease signature motif containing protein [Deinococcus sp. 23YEL01]|uniref:HNH endonuclease n=1 Tax=Deinococcus sp. 23YEL01 TaxID=2745871 RepID=UPI001E357032|nr:HNH endonuclease signature motif containing protein [Deinococcus sp. 23YEL01]
MAGAKPGSDSEPRDALRQSSTEVWTPEELLVTVATYLEMLRLEQSGIGYSKAEYRNRLLAGVLSGRNKGAVEFRMQNISAVLFSVGRPYIVGYKPARNVGANVTKQILGFLAELDPQVPMELGREQPAPPVPPIGNPRPARREVSGWEYERDPAVVAFVLARAQGVCESCGDDAPFVSKSGRPFLEVHHVQTLALEGPDTPQNCVAICPNCHREAHYGQHSAVVQRRLGDFLAEMYPAP